MTVATRVGRAWRALGPTGILFVARAGGLTAAFATAILTARILGPESRGHLATFAILQLIASVGLSVGTGAAAYVLSADEHSDARAIAGGIARWMLVVFAATLAVVVVVDAVGLAGRWLGVSGPLIVALLAAGAAGQYAATAWTQLATGIGRSGAVAVGYIAPPVVIMLGSVAVGLTGTSVTAFMLAQSAGWIIAAFLVLAAAQVRPRLRPAGAGAGVGALVRTGRVAAPGELANVLSYRLDALLLGLIAGAGAVGIYTLAVQVLEPLWIVASAAASGLLLRLRHVPEAAQIRATSRSAGWVAVITLGGVVAVVAVLPWLIEVVGSGFAQTLPVAALLGPGIVLLAVSKILAAYQTAQARLWLGSAIAATSLAVTTGMDLVLIPGFGALGASGASSVGYAVSAVLWIVAFRRYRGRATTIATGLGTP